MMNNNIDNLDLTYAFNLVTSRQEREKASLLMTDVMRRARRTEAHINYTVMCMFAPQYEVDPAGEEATRVHYPQDHVRRGIIPLGTI